MKPTKETKTGVINVERINEKVDLDKVVNAVAYGILFRSILSQWLQYMQWIIYPLELKNAEQGFPPNKSM